MLHRAFTAVFNWLKPYRWFNSEKMWIRQPLKFPKRFFPNGFHYLPQPANSSSVCMELAGIEWGRQGMEPSHKGQPYFFSWVHCPNLKTMVTWHCSTEKHIKTLRCYSVCWEEAGFKVAALNSPRVHSPILARWRCNSILVGLRCRCMKYYEITFESQICQRSPRI